MDGYNVMENNGIPELDRYSNSWVVSRNNVAIGEFFDQSIVEKFDQRKCTIETAYQYLVRINKRG